MVLFSNIGGFIEPYYHVGDEAMFYESYRWYKENVPKVKLVALTEFISHKSLHLTEKKHLRWPLGNKSSRIYFITLLARTLLHRILKINVLSKKEYEFFKLIQSADVLHFSGGGNINSLFPFWLYYSLYAAIIAKMLRKKILIVGQTLGPFNLIDRITLPVFHHLPDLVGIRERVFFKNSKIKSMLDAAYTLPSNSGKRLRSKKTFRIGLSIHPWKGYETQILDAVTHFVKSVKRKKVDVVLIPHEFDKNNKRDLLICKKIASLLPSSIHVYCPTYKELAEKSVEPAIRINTLTSQCDILITTRYHGLIFGMAANVPTIAFQSDDYYHQKNTNALMLIYKKNATRYTVDIRKTDWRTDFVKKTNYVLKNNKAEKNILKKRNEKVIRDREIYTLDHLLSEYYTLEKEKRI